MPPSRFPPSPTLGDSSGAQAQAQNGLTTVQSPAMADVKAGHVDVAHTLLGCIDWDRQDKFCADNHGLIERQLDNRHGVFPRCVPSIQIRISGWDWVGKTKSFDASRDIPMTRVRRFGGDRGPLSGQDELLAH
jgi:hypothetical protein